jgi:hypothetical protein
MKRVVRSSELYFIRGADLKNLAQESVDILPDCPSDCVVIKLNNDGKVVLAAHKELLDVAQDEDYVKTYVIYETYPAILCLLINLIKPIKRRFYIRSRQPLRARLSDILNAGLPRGERNADNAYQLNNKRYHVNFEEAQIMYNELRDSLKENGYDFSNPMFVMLNRKFGAKDQLLQGHHRIGLCKELKIEDISIAFWAAPATYSFFRKFIRLKKFN